MKISVHNDICLDYVIDSSWKAKTIGEDPASPQKLYNDVSFSIPISDFIFLTHPRDYPTKCQK